MVRFGKRDTTMTSSFPESLHAYKKNPAHISIFHCISLFNSKLQQF